MPDGFYRVVQFLRQDSCRNRSVGRGARRDLRLLPLRQPDATDVCAVAPGRSVYCRAITATRSACCMTAIAADRPPRVLTLCVLLNRKRHERLRPRLASALSEMRRHLRRGRHGVHVHWQATGRHRTPPGVVPAMSPVALALRRAQTARTADAAAALRRRRSVSAARLSSPTSANSRIAHPRLAAARSAQNHKIPRPKIYFRDFTEQSDDPTPRAARGGALARSAQGDMGET